MATSVGASRRDAYQPEGRVVLGGAGPRDQPCVDAYGGRGRSAHSVESGWAIAQGRGVWNFARARARAFNKRRIGPRPSPSGGGFRLSLLSTSCLKQIVTLGH